MVSFLYRLGFVISVYDAPSTAISMTVPPSGSAPLPLRNLVDWAMTDIIADVYAVDNGVPRAACRKTSRA
jgi:hypothetical protein